MIDDFKITWWDRLYFKLFVRPKEYLFTDIPRFFKNLWWFRKTLMFTYPWDYGMTIGFLKRSLEFQIIYLERYKENFMSDQSGQHKNMSRAIELLDRIMKDDYTESAEKRIGRKLHKVPWVKIEEERGTVFTHREEDQPLLDENTEIFKEAYRIEAEEWEELMSILKGSYEYHHYIDIAGPEDERDWANSGLKGWWI